MEGLFPRPDTITISAIYKVDKNCKRIRKKCQLVVRDAYCPFHYHVYCEFATLCKGAVQTAGNECLRRP